MLRIPQFLRFRGLSILWREQPSIPSTVLSRQQHHMSPNGSWGGMGINILETAKNACKNDCLNSYTHFNLFSTFLDNCRLLPKDQSVVCWQHSGCCECGSGNWSFGGMTCQFLLYLKVQQRNKDEWHYIYNTICVIQATIVKTPILIRQDCRSTLTYQCFISLSIDMCHDSLHEAFLQPTIQECLSTLVTLHLKVVSSRFMDWVNKITADIYIQRYSIHAAGHHATRVCLTTV